MSEQRGAARPASSVSHYERRLRASMRLMRADQRDAVTREILTGIEAQVKASGGDFGQVAPTLDDPAWVGAQMVNLYGVAPWFKGAVVALAALLAALTVPGVIGQPSEGVGAMAVALSAYGLLVVALFWSGTKAGARAPALAGGTAALVRVLVFYLPQGGMSSGETASAGEFALFGITTALLIVVALAPALALRLQGAAAEP